MSRAVLLCLFFVCGCYESRTFDDVVDSDTSDAEPGDADTRDTAPDPDADTRDTGPDADTRDTAPDDADTGDTAPRDTDVRDALDASDAGDTEPRDTGPDTRPPRPPTCRVTTLPLPRCTAQAEQCLVECDRDGVLDERCASDCHESVDECLDCRLAERFRCIEDFVCVDDLRAYMCCLRDCGTSRPPLLRGDGAAECANRECRELEDSLEICLISQPEVANACESRAVRVCGFR